MPPLVPQSRASLASARPQRTTVLTNQTLQFRTTSASLPTADGPLARPSGSTRWFTRIPPQPIVARRCNIEGGFHFLLP
jgi:hypothetical protein